MAHAANVVNLGSEADFDKLTGAGVPVLVDFWAEWCGPCRMQAPILDELAGELGATKLLVLKVDVDAYGAIAQKYGIMSIPTLMLFVAGAEKKTMVGVQSKDSLIKLLDAQ